jgi:NADP-dependent 3-hydroxy acid dehydrogenase YdfG
MMLKRKRIKMNASEKVAVVTGSSKGIGKAIAIEFAKEGYKIVLNARDENKLSEAANNIKNTIVANEERITTWQVMYRTKTFAHL